MKVERQDLPLNWKKRQHFFKLLDNYFKQQSLAQQTAHTIAPSAPPAETVLSSVELASLLPTEEDPQPLEADDLGFVGVFRSHGFVASAPRSYAGEDPTNVL